MGLISQIIGLIFGDGRNVIRETAEVFRENAENGAQRSEAVQVQAMKQYAAEFAAPRKGWFDRLMDGLNRLPRPAMAFGTLGLFVAAMIDPVWFAARMQGIILVPEPLWWLLGVIVSFYFGARHQVKSQQFQREIVDTMGRVPQVLTNLQKLQTLQPNTVAKAATNAATKTVNKVAPPKSAAPDTMPVERDDNPALSAWRETAARAAPATM